MTLLGKIFSIKKITNTINRTYAFKNNLKIIYLSAKAVKNNINKINQLFALCVSPIFNI